MSKEALPLVKWAGGKAQLLLQMGAFFPKDYRTYFEPFVGGGAVFFHLRPERAVLADLNPELINLYVSVRDHPNDVMEALERHFPRRKSETYFYRLRGRNPARLSPAERAARTLFLNKTCFNGLYRVNAEGRFNVPWGGYKNPTIYKRDNVLAVSALLQGKKILHADYRKALESANFGDFVYLDPPYHPLSVTSSFTSYTKEDFGDTEQRQLADAYHRLDGKGVRLMLSNSSTPLVRSLYEGFRVETLKAKRAINSRGTGRGAIDELLVMNYA